MSDGGTSNDQRTAEHRTGGGPPGVEQPVSGALAATSGTAAAASGEAGRKSLRFSSLSGQLRGRPVDHRILGLFYGVTPDGCVEAVWAEDGRDNIRLSKFHRGGLDCHFVPRRREPLLLDRLRSDVRYVFGFDLVEVISPQQIGTRAQEVVREKLWAEATKRWRPWKQSDLPAE